MHDKTLSKIAGRLLHRRASTSRPARDRTGTETLGLDERKVLLFADGALAPAEEEQLAEEVAAALPLGWSLQPRAKEMLHTVSDHLGGEPGLLRWLDRHPGLPRLTARLVALMGNLDTFGEDPGVVEALRSSRAERPLPEELKGILPPETGEETLGDIAYHIEELLFDRRWQEAARVALAAADWLRDAARRAASPTPAVKEAAEVMDHLHREISDAGMPPGP
jgi:hypothetical protein